LLEEYQLIEYGDYRIDDGNNSGSFFAHGVIFWTWELGTTGCRRNFFIP